MKDSNWDIGAVVRSCNVNRPNNIVAPNLGLETFEKDDENSLDRLLAADLTNFNDIFSMDFLVTYQENLDYQSSEIINFTNYVPIIADQVKIMDQNDNQQFLQPIQPNQFSQQIFLPPPPAAIACAPAAAAAPQEWIDMQQQRVMPANVYPTFTLPKRNPLIRNQKRKNQSISIIYELLQEELTDDIWTWWKCGQKSIKGSPFPRNYYKCSTSKLCKAKKQIEKSPMNENFFLVGYSGEHNHDPPTNLPTNRSSLPDWSSSSKDKLPKGINIVPRALSLNASSSSSKRAKHSRAATSPN